MRIKFYISMSSNHTAKRSEVVNVPDDELENLALDEQRDVVESYFQAWLAQELDYGWVREDVDEA